MSYVVAYISESCNCSDEDTKFKHSTKWLLVNFDLKVNTKYQSEMITSYSKEIYFSKRGILDKNVCSDIAIFRGFIVSLKAKPHQKDWFRKEMEVLKSYN